MDSKEVYQYLDFLEPNLGHYKKTGTQVKFNCPKCDEGNKYNLELNFDIKVFHCWSCGYKGSLYFLYKDYANSSLWRQLDVFKYSKKEVDVEKQIVFPSKTISYIRDKNCYEYLVKTRGIDERYLDSRSVKYVYSNDEIYYNNIFFPFYEKKQLISGCLYNLSTGKYRNLSKLNFIPYKEFIDVNYPITITEGVIDCLSSINAIPLLGTNINGEILKFLYDRNIILALDNKFSIGHYSKIMKQLDNSSIKSLEIFDLKEYEDMNDFYIKDKNGFYEQYRTHFYAFNSLC